MNYWADIIKALAEILKAVAWPSVACVVILYCLKGKHWDKFIEIIANRKIEIQAQGIKLLIDKLDQKVHLSSIHRKELKNLTANEVWALTTFKEHSYKSLTPALKVMAITLQEAGLVKIEKGDIIVTDEGRELISIATNLF